MGSHGYPVVREGAKELGLSIFPIHSIFNGEPRSYLEFPNHLIDQEFRKAQGEVDTACWLRILLWSG